MEMLLQFDSLFELWGAFVLASFIELCLCVMCAGGGPRQHHKGIG
jgi:hypothetical protein